MSVNTLQIQTIDEKKRKRAVMDFLVNRPGDEYLFQKFGRSSKNKMMNVSRSQGNVTFFQYDNFTDYSEDLAVAEVHQLTTEATNMGERRENWFQINGKQFEIALRATNVKEHGQRSEKLLKENLLHKLLEGNEKTIAANIGSQKIAVAGDIPKCGGLGAILNKNIDAGVGAVNGGYNSTTGLYEARVPGTPRQLTKDQINNSLQSIFTSTGRNKNRIVFLPTVLRQVFNSFTGTAQNHVNVTQDNKVSLVDTVSFYVSDYGKIQIRTPHVMNYSATGLNKSLLIIDPDNFHVLYGETYGEYTIEKERLATDSSTKYVGHSEITVIASEAHHGAVHDVTA